MAGSRFISIGYWTSTEEADIEVIDAGSAAAAAEQHRARRLRADGEVLRDWVYVATLDASGRPRQAARGAEAPGPVERLQRGAGGTPYLVIGFLASTGEAVVEISLAESAGAATAACLDAQARDYQYVCTFNQSGKAVLTVENFEVERVRTPLHLIRGS